MKAAPMLRAWLHRLRGSGVRFHMRHRWTGWADETSTRARLRHAGRRSRRFAPMPWCSRSAARAGRGSARTPPGCRTSKRAECACCRSSRRIAASTWPGASTSAAASRASRSSRWRSALPRGEDVDWRVGECLITATGIEGSLVYALSAPIRERLNQSARRGTTILLDLAPGLSQAARASKKSRIRAAPGRCRAICRAACISRA